MNQFQNPKGQKPASPDLRCLQAHPSIGKDSGNLRLHSGEETVLMRAPAMGKLPLLTPREVIANIESLGFVFKHQVGSHAQYEKAATATHVRAVVTVDMGYPRFSKDGMQRMIRQARVAGYSKDEFCSGVTNKAVPAEIPIVPIPVTAKPAKGGKR
jgi:predicted RNA binding protein YcfA (HicA-like mRNA interferase family)